MLILIRRAAGDLLSGQTPGDPQEAGRFPADRLVALRRTNMRSTSPFVNSDPPDIVALF
jgi:hypothetical protein